MKAKFFLLLLLPSCLSHTENDFLKVFSETTTIRHSPVGIAPKDLPSAFQVAVIDTFLIVNHSSPKRDGSVFYFYSLNSNKKLGELLQINQGDSLSACKILGTTRWKVQSSHILFSYKNVMHTFQLPQQLSNTDCHFDTVLNYSSIKKVWSCTRLNDSIFILWAAFKKGRVGILNAHTMQYKTYFGYPDSLTMKDVGDDVKTQFFQVRHTPHPDGERFAWVVVGDIFEILEYKNGNLSVIKGYYREMPKYFCKDSTITQNTIFPTAANAPHITDTTKKAKDYIFSREHRRGLQSECGTKKYLYLLHSKATLGEAIYSTNTLLVFDWNGKPVKKYEMDIPVRGIFTNDDKILYAVAEKNGKPLIVTFTLEGL